MNVRIALAIFATSFVNFAPAFADFLVYTDRDAWTAAAGGASPDLNEDFNSFTQDTNYPVTAGFVTFSAPDANSVFHYIDAAPFGTPGAFDGSSYAVLRTASDVFSTLVEFDEVEAIGFDFLNLNISGDMQITLGNGQSLSIVDPGPSPSFFGVLSTEGETISSIMFETGDSNLSYSSDNWSAYTVVVPEPTSSLAICVALFVIFSSRRKNN